MNIRYDFIMHWLFAIAWSLLALSGFAMVGAKYGWLLNFNYGMADYVHRLTAMVFVVLTFISIFYEVYRSYKNNDKYLAWHIIGKSGYQLFTFITAMILIITGALIWICDALDITAVGFALFIHEYISYIALASVIWHIYKKAHALIWPKKAEAKAPDKIGGGKGAPKAMV